MATKPQYLKLLRQLLILPDDHPQKNKFTELNLPALRLEVSIAFWRDEQRAIFDPAAPSIEDRIRAVRLLSQVGIPIVLRIDPLLPHNPLPGGKTQADFDLPPAQSPDDLVKLVGFAAQINALHIVYSAAKIVQPRLKFLSPTMKNLKILFEYLAQPNKLVFRGGSWRLPNEVALKYIIKPFVEMCQSYDVTAKFCKQNLVETP